MKKKITVCLLVLNVLAGYCFGQNFKPDSIIQRAVEFHVERFTRILEVEKNYESAVEYVDPLIWDFPGGRALQLERFADTDRMLKQYMGIESKRIDTIIVPQMTTIVRQDSIIQCLFKPTVRVVFTLGAFPEKTMFMSERQYKKLKKQHEKQSKKGPMMAIKDSYWIAISRDYGEHWFFIDTSYDTPAELRKWYPYLSETLHWEVSKKDRRKWKD